MRLERLGRMVGIGALGLGGVITLFSLIRLDGGGLAVGVLLGIYGLALFVLVEMYREVRATREFLAILLARSKEVKQEA